MKIPKKLTKANISVLTKFYNRLDKRYDYAKRLQCKLINDYGIDTEEDNANLGMMDEILSRLNNAIEELEAWNENEQSFYKRLPVTGI